jgi:cytochrome c oxidase subunit 4
MVAGTDVPASSAAVQASGPAHDHGTAGHVVPLWLLAAVLAVLLFLTVVTVAVTYVDLGAANIFVALFIAVVKAALVLLYFMHLRWDSPFNSLVIISALLFVAVFLAFAMIDTAEYRPVVDDAVRTMMSR